MNQSRFELIRSVVAVITALFLLTMVFPMAPVDAAGHAGGGTVVATGNITDFIWSSDGTRVAYVECPDGQSWGELWVGDWDGRAVKNLQSIYSEIESTALEDWQGDWILFRPRHENGDPTEYYGRGELWKMRDDGTDLTQITFTYTNGIRTEWWNTYYTNRGTAGWGRFVPGSDLVYFSAHDGNGWWQAHTCKADGSDQWKLISVDTFSFTIGMSPTGNKLVWGTSWYYNEPTTLMASNVDGTGTTTIKELSYTSWPLVLADGDTVLYNSPSGNISAVQMDGTNDRVVIDDEYANYLVAYDPVDGQSFLMRSNRGADGNAHIFSIDVDGTDIAQITEGAYNDDIAMYSPNGAAILYRRLPVGAGASSYELVITWTASLIEDLPSATISMMIIGGQLGNTINATLTIGFYSEGGEVGIGFRQELLRISSGPVYARAVGLGYDEMRERPFFYTIHGNVTNPALPPSPVSSRQHAGWTVSEWCGAWTGPISEQNITEATFCGDIVEFENLTVYFEDGSSFVCGPNVITLGANFTRTEDVWNTSVIIETSDAQGISVDNNVVTISLRYSEPISSTVTVATIAIVAVVAVVLCFKRAVTGRNLQNRIADEYYS